MIDYTNESKWEKIDLYMDYVVKAIAKLSTLADPELNGYTDRGDYVYNSLKEIKPDTVLNIECAYFNKSYMSGYITDDFDGLLKLGKEHIKNKLKWLMENGKISGCTIANYSQNIRIYIVDDDIELNSYGFWFFQYNYFNRSIYRANKESEKNDGTGRNPNGKWISIFINKHIIGPKAEDEEGTIRLLYNIYINLFVREFGCLEGYGISYNRSTSSFVKNVALFYEEDKDANTIMFEKGFCFEPYNNSNVIVDPINEELYMYVLYTSPVSFMVNRFKTPRTMLNKVIFETMIDKKTHNNVREGSMSLKAFCDRYPNFITDKLEFDWYYDDLNVLCAKAIPYYV